ncbi:TPA: flagellar motor switch protein FliM [Candidatus Sumerlaeota bacterium]|nr:flagellar motor switch protein FliM [Candidatus Sumerlaeota bacterium]
MGEVLSQEEVDALLAGLTGGNIKSGTDAPAKDGAFAPYDFTNQDRVVRGKLPTLEMVHERFTRFFRQSISGAMQRIVDVNMLNADMTKFGEFMRGQSIPSSYHIFRLDPLKGSSLLVLEGKLVYTMVNSFFGGKGTSYYKMEGRDFTPIENRLIKTVVDIMLRDYARAWQPVQKLDVIHMRSEVNPQFVSIVTTSDPVWVVEIEMSFEDVSEKLFFCLPYSTIEPLKEKLRARFQSESMDTENTWAGRIKESLRQVPIDLRVRLGTSEITAREVMNLKVGDILPLKERNGTALNVYLEDVLKFRAVGGVTRGSKSIQITDILKQEP